MQFLSLSQNKDAQVSRSHLTSRFRQSLYNNIQSIDFTTGERIEKKSMLHYTQWNTHGLLIYGISHGVASAMTPEYWVDELRIIEMKVQDYTNIGHHGCKINHRDIITIIVPLIIHLPIPYYQPQVSIHELWEAVKFLHPFSVTFKLLQVEGALN
ncbi:hypothetical protein C0J52_27669 [Blattella germanica]|nr:hypothetical protein C0J52_27669 [Blattella germanica]